MKTTISILSLFLILTSCFAQKQDIDVFEKKEGSKVIVMARNTGKVEYSVTLDITSKGMDVTPSMKVVSVIPAGMMKEMANLVPRPGESWEYGYKVSFVQTGPTPEVKPNTTASAGSQPSNTTVKPAPTPSTDVSKANVILYTKPGCSRCAFVKKQLTAQGIAFEEYSTSSQSPEINNMWTGLRNSGFSGGSVTMPVVRADGKYYYNIPDLQGFVDKLKK